MYKLLIILFLLTGCGLLKPQKEIVTIKETKKKDRLDRNVDCVVKLVGVDALPVNAGKICNDIFKR